MWKFSHSFCLLFFWCVCAFHLRFVSLFDAYFTCVRVVCVRCYIFSDFLSLNLCCTTRESRSGAVVFLEKLKKKKRGDVQLYKKALSIGKRNFAECYDFTVPGHSFLVFFSFRLRVWFCSFRICVALWFSRALRKQQERRKKKKTNAKKSKQTKLEIVSGRTKNLVALEENMIYGDGRNASGAKFSGSVLGLRKLRWKNSAFCIDTTGRFRVDVEKRTISVVKSEHSRQELGRLCCKGRRKAIDAGMVLFALAHSRQWGLRFLANV